MSVGLQAPPDFIYVSMQAEKPEKKTFIPSPSVRTLKIQPKVRETRESQTITSEIKLSGNWLEELGFHYGKKVVVTTMKDLLIIRVQED